MATATATAKKNSHNHYAPKQKSSRKPFKDISNVGKSSKTNASDNHNLDRLLLVQTDLSSLIHQIDELVAQAFKLEKGRKEIESFINVLSEMHSSLTPWVPKFQKALSCQSKGACEPSTENNFFHAPDEDTCNVVDNPDETKSTSMVENPDETTLPSLVSPSPLVSWRGGDCTIERGRQLFLLTPLPRSKALSTKSVVKTIPSNSTTIFALPKETSNDFPDDHDCVAANPTPCKVSTSIECGIASPPSFSKGKQKGALMTPCLKQSPPRSCVVLDLEPIYETRKSTPYPFGIQNFSGFDSSEPSSSEVSDKFRNKRTEGVGLMNWQISPPKSCIIMELPDEKPLKNDPCVLNQTRAVSLMKENDIRGICDQEVLGPRVAMVESTPMAKVPGPTPSEFLSTVQTGKRRGENTLKRELWTRFEAASAHELRFKDSTIQEATQKGFLDKLEEAS